MTTGLEVKRSCNWVASFTNISKAESASLAAQIMSVAPDACSRELELSFHDVVSEQKNIIPASKIIFGLFQKPQSFTFDVEVNFLDNNNPAHRWVYTKCKVKEFWHSNLDYKESEPLVLTINLTYAKVIIGNTPLNIILQSEKDEDTQGDK